MVLLPGDQVFKSMILWGPLPFKQPLVSSNTYRELIFFPLHLAALPYILGTLHCRPLVSPFWRYWVSLCLTANINIWEQKRHVVPWSFSSATTLPQRYQRIPILRLLVWKKPLCNHVFSYFLLLLLPEKAAWVKGKAEYKPGSVYHCHRIPNRFHDCYLRLAHLHSCGISWIPNVPWIKL